MKKFVVSSLILLFLISSNVFASTVIDRSIEMYRESDGKWSGRIYEAKINDNNQLQLWLLGKNLNATLCTNYDIVLSNSSKELYRHKRQLPNSKGTFQQTEYITLPTGNYNNVVTRYDCTTNNFYDVKSIRSLNFVIPSSPIIICSYWKHLFGLC